MGDTERWNEVFARAISIQPQDNAFTWIDLARFYIHSDKKKARRAVAKAEGLAPDNASKWMGVGSVYQLLYEYKRAEAAYKRAIALEPKWAGHLAQLAALYFVWGKDAKARDACRDLAELDRGWAERMCSSY